MPLDPKITITAKIPSSLHDKLLEAVKSKKFTDKTEGITQGLNVILGITQQEPSCNTQDLLNVIQDKEAEIQVLRSDIQKYLSKLEELDPSEIATLRAREDVLRVLLDEKDRRIEDLSNNLRDLRVFAYKPVSQGESCNTAVIPRNMKAVGRILKICVVCGTEFYAENSRRIYCSPSCNTRACRQRKKSSQ